MALLAAAAPWLLRAGSMVITSIGINEVVNDVFGIGSGNEETNNTYTGEVQQTNNPGNGGFSLGIVPLAVLGGLAYMVFKK